MAGFTLAIVIVPVLIALAAVLVFLIWRAKHR